MEPSKEFQTYSLADFFVPDTDDPMTPSREFTAWRRETAWATQLYEQSLLEGPVPRTALSVDGKRKPVINMASYNYLGLSRHPETVAAAKEALDRYGVGACGSPILSGMTDLHRRLEARLSSFLMRDRTMLFNSGFGGALGMLAGVLRRGDAAVMDSKCHISLVEGAKLSGARVVQFDHNSPASLDACLARSAATPRRIVVTEGIFSMDGDMADLPSLVPVLDSHKVGLVIDEAHSILTCGETGQGVGEHFGVEDRIVLKYATFSKAFGALGGFVSGHEDTIDYLRLYASSYGFSCALPPAVVAAVIAGLDIATRGPELRLKLAENARYFRERLQGLGVDTGESTTQVVPIIVGSDRRLLYELGLQLRERGLFLAPVDYPSVPEDSVRFRASVTTEHTRADLDESLNIINDVIVPRIKKG